MKPFRVVQVYSRAFMYRKKLEEIGAVFTERDVFNRFWGTEFTIEKPRGEGAQSRIKAIDSL